MAKRKTADQKRGLELLDAGIIDIRLWRNTLAERRVELQGEIISTQQKLREVNGEVAELTELLELSR